MQSKLNCEVIAICGDAGAGKDVVASRLVEDHGFSLVRIAEPLWAALEAVIPEVKDYVEAYGRDRAKSVPFGGLSARSHLIAIGKALKTHLGEAGWIEQMIRQAAVLHGAERIVVPDLRFPAEAAAIQDLCTNVSIVKVVRPGLVKCEAFRDDVTETSHSRIACNHIVDNRYDVAHLEECADDLAWRYYPGQPEASIYG